MKTIKSRESNKRPHLEHLIMFIFIHMGDALLSLLGVFPND